jgi:hypothetical protein
VFVVAYALIPFAGKEKSQGVNTIDLFQQKLVYSMLLPGNA